MKKNAVLLAGIAILFIVAFGAAATLYLRSQRAVHAERVAKESEIDAEIFVRPHSRTLGPENAKVTVIEFLDPECESCRAAYPMVKQLLSEYGDQVRLVIRYMPLHHNSMIAIGALEAAAAQGRYWEFLELLFQNQPLWGSHHAPRPELIPEFAKQLGLDMQAYERFMNAGGHKALVEIDKNDARRLGIRGTPTFFVNGKLLDQPGYEPLKALIDSELAR